MDATLIECSECGGNFAQLLGHGGECAECQTCGKVLHIPSDITPNMDPGERTVWTEAELLGYVTDDAPDSL